ncbi:hypothetical protein II906_12680 [bacterium]|nr:hypothetical protein [bacterium]
MFHYDRWTQKEEIKLITSISLNLLKEDGTIYLLSSYGLLTQDIFEAYSKQDYSKLKNKIYYTVIQPEYRAKRRLLYRQLDIFQDYIFMIDSAILSFYQNNFLCAYFTLVPVIEGLLRKWSKNPHFKISKNMKDFLRKKTNEIYKVHPSSDLWLINNLILIRKVANYYFRHSDYCPKGFALNRHIPAHLLRSPSYIQSISNFIKLLNFIDLIAEINSYEYDFGTPKSVKVSEGCYESLYDYEITGEKEKIDYAKLLSNSQNFSIMIKLVKLYDEYKFKIS